MIVSNPLTADQYIRRVRSLMSAGEPTRFIMAGDGVNINMRVSLEDFKYEIRFGECSDFYYSLPLMKYRSHSAKRIVIPTGSA